MINIALKFFVVEYSMMENTTSIRTLENVLRDNIRNVHNGMPKDYLPVGLFNLREEADRFDQQFSPNYRPGSSIRVPQPELATNRGMA